MAKTRKHEKNLARVQSMLDGTYGGKIQSGYEKAEVTRKVGDKWTDSDGVQWEQKNGYRSKVSVMPDVGMFHQQCKVCDTNCSLEKRHKHTWVRYERCYHCQMNFELDLQSKRIGNSGNKHRFWVRLQQLHNMDAVEREMEQWVEEKSKLDEEKIYDMSIANALANSNVDTSMKINKKLIN